MVDISMIPQILSSLKGASEMANALIGMRDEAKLRSQLQEINNTLMTAQSSALSAQMQMNELIDKNRTLQQKLDDLDEWNDVKNRYVLKDYGSETFAYALIESKSNEPDHKLCAICFHKRVKSILQFDYKSHIGRSVYKCLACNNNTNLGSRTEQSFRSSHAGSWLA